MKERDGSMSRAAMHSRTRIPAFFSNLLPEGPLRDYLAARAGVKPQREFYLLNALRDDLPGAVWLQPVEEGKPPIPADGGVGLDREDEQQQPDALRFSLAGIQLKFSAVMEASGGLTIPAHGVGGSYIVKLPSTRFHDVPQNEYSMMMIARALGMQVAEVELRQSSSVKGLPPDLPENFGESLVVKRFDREGKKRMHMEDFAQVYDLYPHEKYSRVSYGGIAGVVFKEGGAEQLQEYVRRLTFTVLIGNADMHLKNWSLLYTQPQQPVLSPAYDMLSTIRYLPDPRLALSIAGEKVMSSIDEAHFRKMAAKAQLPESLVVRTMKETAASFRDRWPEFKASLPMDAALVAAIETHQKQLKI
jgi:serine/threonine-protein kinase HipA